MKKSWFSTHSLCLISKKDGKVLAKWKRHESDKPFIEKIVYLLMNNIPHTAEWKKDVKT